MMRYLLALALAAFAAAAQAQSLREALEAAWQRTQNERVRDAHLGEAEARLVTANAPLPDALQVGLDVRRDVGSRRRGALEVEPGLAIPLWRPGERDALRSVAQRDQASAGRDSEARKLELAGEVRERAWRVAAAFADRDLARARLDAAAALENDVERRVRAGDLARTDLLRAQSERYAAQGALAPAESSATAEMAAWKVLTGFERAPEALESGAGESGLDRHPGLAALREKAEAARARLALARTANRGRTEVEISARAERDASGEPFGHSLNFGVRIPLESAPHFAERIAGASRELTEAEVAFAQARMRLETALAHATGEERGAQAALALSSERLQVATEHEQLLQRAYSLGERPLETLLRAREVRLHAQQAKVAAEIALGRARSRIQQALGALP